MNLVQPLGTPFLDFVHDLALRDIPGDVLDTARTCLLDLLGTAAAGSAQPSARLIRDHAAEHFAAGAAPARLLFDGRPVSPAGAALAGGMTIDAVDAHDGHKLTKGHVGCSVLPAALALCEARGVADGGDFLAALVLGYEVGTRAGMALHATAAEYHTSGAWGAVACAAVGARVLGLDRAATREAVGIAEYHGPRSQMMRVVETPTMLKDGSGWGAMAGVSAAFLAASGFTGAPAVTVEGDDVAAVWADLGHRWRLREQYFKPYPVCRWAHAPIDAVLALRAAHGLAAAEIARVEVATFEAAVRLGTRRPRCSDAAQYSLPFAVAAAAARGQVGPAEIDETALDDPEILRLADSMVVETDPELERAFPGRRLARVALVLADGRRLDSAPADPRGDPENPLAPEELRDKYARFAEPRLGKLRAARLEATVARLGADAGLAELLDLVGPAPVLAQN
ncbi:MAG: MmgE/PrpD family protein [Hyphomicrobiales bacterium]|nr:MmgE/PrpD family protein [Hyphomicrobiales bacterium]MCP5373824.1 MmgE/PrpD family protein [Hyphomicrobiales bacterium]